jgi:hypothetical protein
MHNTLLILLTILVIRTNVVGQASNVVEEETRAYYSKWIGVRAPEFPHLFSQRQNDSSELHLHDYQGKRLLLISFNSGDFVNRSRDEATLMNQLRILHNLKQQQSTNVAVIGFTYDPAFFMPDILNSPPEIIKVTDFPIVNCNKLRHDPLQEPYNLLQRWPSLLVIDKTGVIIGVYSPPLLESNIVQAITINDWLGNIRLSPREEAPAAVTNWSCRKFWVVFAYTKDLIQGSKFKTEFGKMKRVYFADEIPVDEVSGTKVFEGLKLKKNVKAGEAIRNSDFDK